ncbi:hypothetical protein ACF0H5_011693 [Mactra antiquata]
MTNLYILVTLLCLIPVGMAMIIVDPLQCEQICAGTIPEHDESAAAHCGCNPHGHKHHTTTLAPDQLSKTTLSMCDYLCSIQMGGSACDCSISIVPGKKRSKLLQIFK